MGKHILKLVDEENDIYECEKCGARGKYTELLHQECKENNDEEEQDKPNSFKGLLGNWVFDL